MSLIEHKTDRYALRIGVDRDDSLGREGVDTYWLPDDTTFEIEVFEPQWVAGASVTERTIKCTTCRGSGEMESSDSTDDCIYKCWACDGTGKIADRRKPDPGAVSDRDALRLMLSRLLDVALVDGYGETVADEARALLTTIGGR
jgi:hypothetical protein